MTSFARKRLKIAQKSFHSFIEIGKDERLHQVFGSPRFYCIPRHCLVSYTGEHDNADGWIDSLDFLQNIQSRHSGHHDVQKDNGRLELSHQLNGRRPVQGREDVIAPEGSEFPYNCADLRLVVHYHYSFFHCPTSRISTGISIKKDAPPSSLFSARICPPCSLMIVWQM